MASTAAIATKVCPRCEGTFGGGADFCPRDGARLERREVALPPRESDSYLGRVIAGDIELQSVAGEGAMGRVYRAHQRGIERDVAVKILHRELSANSSLVQRFHREAKIASKLQHPHVVDVYLAGQLDDGAMYIVMEYLDGMSLAAALAAAGGRLEAGRAVSVVMQMCDAVGEGHARGIVHRDLKPENVVLVRRGEVADWVKVLDFGIAKVSLGEQSMETAAGLIFGTARYISPEGAQGAKVGPAGDVYALATILYEALCGRTPFDGEPLGMLVKHIHEQPPPLASWPAGKDVPEPLARLIMDNLAKEPTRRAANALAFGNLLASAARDARLVVSDVGVVARLSHLPEAPSPPPPEPPSLSRRVAVEPTIDDAVALGLSPGPPAAAPASAPRIAVVTVPGAPALAPGPAAPAAPAPAAPTPAAPSPAPAAPSRGPWLVVVPLVFLLGAAVSALVLSRANLGVDPDHARHVDRTRRALTEGHYVAPPGESVKDLVAEGLGKWPEDTELKAMRSQAEHEMITMAITARASGDLIGARDLAREAHALDPTDNSARTMRAQCEDELAAISAGGAGYKGGLPRLIFESPAVAKTAQRVEMTARLVPAAGAGAKITGVKASVNPNGQSTSGLPVTLSSTDPTSVRVVVIAGPPRSYDVSFEANVDGTVVRAMRDLDVVP